MRRWFVDSRRSQAHERSMQLGRFGIELRRAAAAASERKLNTPPWHNEPSVGVLIWQLRSTRCYLCLYDALCSIPSLSLTLECTRQRVATSLKLEREPLHTTTPRALPTLTNTPTPTSFEQARSTKQALHSTPPRSMDRSSERESESNNTRLLRRSINKRLSLIKHRGLPCIPYRRYRPLVSSSIRNANQPANQPTTRGLRDSNMPLYHYAGGLSTIRGEVVVASHS